MKKTIRVALAQINCTVGDFDGNLKKISDNIKRASQSGCDIISFPELSITGYPPEDLLLKSAFIDDNLEALKKLAKRVNGIAAIVGYVDKAGKDIYNAAAVIHNGEVRGVYHKTLLPNYGVFDEKRYFKAGPESRVFRYGDICLGVTICEDVWHMPGPVTEEASLGAKLIININSSPYHAGKTREREMAVRAQARANRVHICYTNMVGGQDELVFDGQSMIVDASSKVIARAEPFKEDLLLADLDIETCNTPAKAPKVIPLGNGISGKARPALPVRKETKLLDPANEVYHALLLGLKDYVTKNAFTKVVIGLSGGIDSAIVAALAADALGRENVTGVFMPSRYSSRESETDAKLVANNLGIKFITISIEHIFKIYLLTLEPHFAGTEKNIAEENLQARIRGNILMALSNKLGPLVLTTGNKSEVSTGYATLYGDMAGGFAVIKDVPKTLVYKLARFRNTLGNVIPESVFTKEPTAELKPNQKDSDTLPPYETLDRILKAYVEEDKGMDEVLSLGLDIQTAHKVFSMVDKSEYKRRQSPPGIKITPRAFGRDRRMPITNRYREY